MAGPFFPIPRILCPTTYGNVALRASGRECASLRKSAARKCERQSARQIIGMHSGNVYRVVGAYPPVVCYDDDSTCSTRIFRRAAPALHPREGLRAAERKHKEGEPLLPLVISLFRAQTSRASLYPAFVPELRVGSSFPSSDMRNILFDLKRDEENTCPPRVPRSIYIH